MAAASIAVDLSTQHDPDSMHWRPLLAFGQQAEALRRYRQGDMVAVSGRLQRSAWTDKEGAQHVDLQLIVDQVTNSRTIRSGGKPTAKPADVRDDYREPARSAVPATRRHSEVMPCPRTANAAQSERG